MALCLQAYEAEARTFLTRPDDEVQQQIAATRAEWESVQASSTFDQVIVRPTSEHTYACTALHALRRTYCKCTAVHDLPAVKCRVQPTLKVWHNTAKQC